MKKCPICNNEMVFFAKKENFSIYKCPKCGFGLTDDTNIQKGEYHRDDTYIEEVALFDNIFQKRVNIINNLIKPGKVLEVGCSTGLLLSILKKQGWEITGVELSQKAAEVAQQRGIDVVIDKFENFKPKQKYDLIILNHVLEHLEDPDEIIKKANFILDSGGLLLVSLPNFDSFSAGMQKDSWPLLLPEEHIWHFTLRSIEMLFSKHKFKIIYEEKTSGIWDYGDPLGGLINSFLGLKKRFFYELLSAVPTFLLTRLGLASGLIVVAKKE